MYCEGRITYREYKDKNDQQRFITEIVLDDFIVFHDNGESPTVEKDTDTTAKKEVSGAKEEQHQANDEDVNPEDIPF